MNKEQMLLDALNRFGNFTSVTQEFSEEQLGVIYELMEMVEQPHKVSGADTSNKPVLLIQSVVPSTLPEDEENKPYCTDCGNEDLAYIDQYANGNYWKCKECGKEFIH